MSETIYCEISEPTVAYSNHSASFPDSLLSIINPSSLFFEEEIGRFDQVVENSKLEGRAVDLYQDYSTMIRRHLMHSKDSEIAILSRRIWKRHRQALETLIEYQPNLQSELLEWILEKENWEKLTSDLKKKSASPVKYKHVFFCITGCDHFL